MTINFASRQHLKNTEIMHWDSTRKHRCELLMVKMTFSWGLPFLPFSSSGMWWWCFTTNTWPQILITSCADKFVGPGLHVTLDCMYGRLYSRMSLIYKYETSTLTPLVKLCDILNLALQNVFHAQSYVESAFTYKPELTNKFTMKFLMKNPIRTISLGQYWWAHEKRQLNRHSLWRHWSNNSIADPRIY